MNYDVIVIGNGGAGLTSAIIAKESGAKVAVISKSYPQNSQTAMAQGGINAPITKDAIKNHIEDTIKASSHFANKKMVEKLVNGAKEAIEWLDEIGVVFSRDKSGEIAKRRLGGVKEKRACYAQDWTGLKILHSLIDEANKQRVDFFNEYILLDLLIEDNQIFGVVVLEIKNSKIHIINSKAVILATGGYLSIYHNFTTNSAINTGDGIAIAKRAGAKLSDLEFIQFHPTALRKSKILISESARGEGGILLNQKGERFVDELQTRDEVSRAIFREIERGNKVFLDIRHLGEEFINENLPQERKLALHYEGVDPIKELIPISPAGHYSMGGIDVNEHHQTSIEGLFAVGECANAKIHGGNRLGGNSLLEIIVFGREVGKKASQFAKEQRDRVVDFSEKEKEITSYITSIFEKSPTIDFYQLKNELGKKFFYQCGIFRNEKDLKELKEWLLNIQREINKIGIVDKSKIYNRNLIDFLEFKNTIEVGIEVVTSAIERRESRGAHFRSDYPFLDEKLNRIGDIC